MKHWATSLRRKFIHVATIWHGYLQLNWKHAKHSPKKGRRKKKQQPINTFTSFVSMDHLHMHSNRGILVNIHMSPTFEFIQIRSIANWIQQFRIVSKQFGWCECWKIFISSEWRWYWCELCFNEREIKIRFHLLCKNSRCSVCVRVLGEQILRSTFCCCASSLFVPALMDFLHYNFTLLMKLFTGGGCHHTLHSPFAV